MKGGHKDTVVALLQRGADSITPLMKAVEEGVKHDVMVLVEAGVPLNQRDSDGCTALIRSAQCGFNEILTYLLITAKANPDVKDKYGETALSKATQKNSLEIVKTLIESGANIEIANTSGTTALLIAAQYGHTDCVRLLISASANSKHQNNEGNTAIMIASDKNSDACTVRELLKMKPNIDHQNKYGKTALMLAAESGTKDIITELIDAGADLNKKDRYNDTALTIAQQYEHEDVVKAIEGWGLGDLDNVRK